MICLDLFNHTFLQGTNLFGVSGRFLRAWILYSFQKLILSIIKQSLDNDNDKYWSTWTIVRGSVSFSPRLLARWAVLPRIKFLFISQRSSFLNRNRFRLFVCSSVWTIWCTGEMWHTFFILSKWYILWDCYIIAAQCIRLKLHNWFPYNAIVIKSHIWTKHDWLHSVNMNILFRDQTKSLLYHQIICLYLIIVNHCSTPTWIGIWNEH